ncbi:hypothetical protein ES702_00112 [subsurface metagenome]
MKRKIQKRKISHIDGKEDGVQGEDEEFNTAPE